jgi:hypothetical protein
VTNNAVLDIAIGLVLMYLVLSLMGTVLNEYVATLRGLRASTLRTAMESILDNPTLRADFYNHGLIDGLNQATGDHASYFSGQTFAMALVGSLDVTKPLPSFADVKTAIENLPDCNIRDAMLSQLTKANGDLDKLRDGFANYFDASMDRVSGIYKRKLKLISFLVGCVIVVVLNADSINVGKALWSDTSLRAQMVDNAKEFLKTNTTLTTGTADKTTTAPATEDPAKFGEKTAQFAKSLDKLDSSIRPLPIGWKLSYFPDWFSWAALWWVITKTIGLVITVLAVSLGAPFWFDMLSNFMNMRGSGAKPQSTTQPS